MKGIQVVRIQVVTVIGGVYRHYKGDKYVVIGRTLESTNGRDRVPNVTYVSLVKGSINSRDEAQFHEWVDVETGVRVTGDSAPTVKSKPRFEFLERETEVALGFRDE
jgi:hypothetical protein